MCQSLMRNARGGIWRDRSRRQGETRSRNGGEDASSGTREHAPGGSSPVRYRRVISVRRQMAGRNTPQ
ncbi:uncharacterized protein THITE_2122706 [Thermothielavioides terrestris NRRL 8126]|uniref:Uncharacterized protein n=1 Tax=Thermothielavioides terrestris (strain ATCC 38088 / NRRL 8126) TaxID=578455 RepID=G2RDZ1_THETT|nr:uncharacterized protein THITE_2122706 [Thermothielavioides terrestris NRRL 8126]AEO70874.1 hypothetical protein THITE_2122706 [Thermothielavioides terrestris NRRL 8126]